MSKSNSSCTDEYAPLLPISGCMLNEMFQRNASKFSIFYIGTYTKTQSCFFHFLFHANFPNECPAGHGPGHSLHKVAQNEK